MTLNKTDIFDVKKIADEYHNFFLNIGTDLANKIPNALKLYLIFIQLKLTLAWNLNRYYSMNWKKLFIFT